MLSLLKQEANKTYTENGAVTYRSSLSDCVDLFASIGALRNATEDEIVSRFIKAYTEDGDVAMKILFFARDVRGGLGERRAFRTILKWLALNNPQSVTNNLEYIAEFGRYDDLLTLLETTCQSAVIDLIIKQLSADLINAEEGNNVSLLAKWLPSVNATNSETIHLAKKIARTLHMSEAEYRKSLSLLRSKIRIIENNLREKDYTFDYEKQPSKALFKYRQAFSRNDAERYNAFMEKVGIGEAKLNAATLTPYDVVRPVFCGKEVSEMEHRAIDASWNSLEDFTNEENALVVVDGSGSMYWDNGTLPAAVAQSLGIYFAERNKGVFKNHFITFSNTPQLVEIKGKDIVDKVIYCASYNEVADTNLESVFKLILNTAVKNKVPQNQLPSKLYIITDMEFNCCIRNSSKTNFENAKEMFKAAGYELPKVIFWNVSSRNRQQPVTFNEQGVALVSGYTPRLFGMVANGELSPYKMMMNAIDVPRYEMIVA